MACKNLPNWNWKKGETLKDTTTNVPFTRNYFDCGIYYFDGTFNVVKFPKGMTLYHGSAALANAVVEFPVGIDYYKKYDISKTSNNIPINPPSNSPQFLNVAATSDESIEEIIAKSFPITAGWYADPSVARLYSGQSGDSRLKTICKDKCIQTYTLKEDVVFYLLDDDYNIAKLFATPSAVIPESKKQDLEKMFNIKNRTPNVQATDNPFSRLRYKKQRVSSRAWDLPFAEWACKTLVNVQGYAGYAATVQYTQAHGGKFHLEFVFCNAFKYLNRDLNNILDWQHNPKNYSGIVKTYMEQLGLYQSTNVNFHAGDLLEHSIWTLLFAEKILREGKVLSPNTSPDFYKIVAFTAFIHDIGKMYPPGTKVNTKRDKFIYFDIPTHPQIGEDYIMGTKSLPIFDTELKQRGTINIDKLFSAFGISNDRANKRAISKVIKLHWEFGNVIKNFNADPRPEVVKADNYADKYISTVFSEFDPGDREKRLAFIFMLLVISIADINATQPFGVNRLTEQSSVLLQGAEPINKVSYFFPFLTNMPKKYRGGNVVEISGINGSTGTSMANLILQKVNTL